MWEGVRKAWVHMSLVDLPLTGWNPESVTQSGVHTLVQLLVRDSCTFPHQALV
jgi:hypothetical protein